MTIGIIPCAGSATRIHGLPKYLLPTPDGYLLDILIKRMRAEGIAPLVGANRFNSGLIKEYAPSAYIYIPETYRTMSETVLAAQNHMKGTEHILFGMPDSYIEDDQCYQKLAAALDDGADVAVGVFFARAGQHKKAGMIRVSGERNQVVEVVDKPDNTDLYILWGALAWKPEFWQQMLPTDPHVGYALPRAIAAGYDVRAVRMDGGYWDCGTYDEYAELTQHLHGRKEASEMVQIYG